MQQMKLINDNREFQFKYMLERSSKKVLRDNDFEDQFIKTDKDQYVIYTSPPGLESVSCLDESKFLHELSLNEKTFKDSLFHNPTSMFDVGSYNPIIQSLKVLPGYSAINKSFSFKELPSNRFNNELWGIINVSKHVNLYKKTDSQSIIDEYNSHNNVLNEDEEDVIDQLVSSGSLFNRLSNKIFKDRLGNPSKELQKTCIHPLSEMKDVIKESIDDDTEITLDEIMKKLGPGIYIDLSCSGMSLLVEKPFKITKSGTIDPTIHYVLTSDETKPIPHPKHLPTDKDDFEREIEEGEGFYYRTDNYVEDEEYMDPEILSDTEYSIFLQPIFLWIRNL